MLLKHLIDVLNQVLSDNPNYEEAEVSFEFEGDLYQVNTVSLGYSKNNCFRTENSLNGWLTRNNYNTIEEANRISIPQINLSVTLNAK